jgi:hypothetical protein
MHICKQKNKMLRLIGNISFLIKEKKGKLCSCGTRENTMILI